jgi:hypothetical protein
MLTQKPGLHSQYSVSYALHDPRNRSSIPDRDKRFHRSSKTDQLWSSPSLLFNKHRGLFPQEKIGRNVKLTSLLHLAPRLRMSYVIVPLVSKRTTLHFPYSDGPCLNSYVNNFYVPLLGSNSSHNFKRKTSAQRSVSCIMLAL